MWLTHPRGAEAVPRDWSQIGYGLMGQVRYEVWKIANCGL